MYVFMFGTVLKQCISAWKLPLLNFWGKPKEVDAGRETAMNKQDNMDSNTVKLHIRTTFITTQSNDRECNKTINVSSHLQSTLTVYILTYFAPLEPYTDCLLD